MDGDLGRLVAAFGRVSRAVVESPARWRAREWAIFGSVALAALCAYVEKRPIQARLQGDGGGDRGGALRQLALFGDAFGSGGATVLFGFIAFTIGRIARKPLLVDTALALGAAGFWCWLLTKTGQIVLAESRPIDGGSMHFFALGGHGVSGHASAAALVYFPVRDVLARRARLPPIRRAVGIGLLAWPAFVGWSRVYLGMHFLWNVILGFAVGSFTGLVATRALGGAFTSLRSREGHPGLGR
jgi:membrane-associated phospholipid phosphatase